MIAHRLTALKNCDLILEMEQGRLVAVKKSAKELFALPE
jgi:ABC-type multidrug transport system fused ATPase/permease subunit